MPERREVVLSLLRREEAAAVLARRFGISENTLYRWRDDFLTGGEAALANGKGKADPRERQIIELKKQSGERDKVIGELTIAKRFYRHIQDVYSHVCIQYRTPTQLGLLERFHRTLKDEEIYWRLYESPAHGRMCLEAFRHRYNTIRPHWALIPPHGGDPMTPHDVYVDGQAMAIPKWQGWAKAAKEKLDQLMSQEAA